MSHFSNMAFPKATRDSAADLDWPFLTGQFETSEHGSTTRAVQLSFSSVSAGRN